ncbi:MAG: site-2 protease family protein [Candidatus Peregrinibacteria bacterium]
MIIVTIIAFIVIFSVIVLIHEWGHFTMARRAGIQVEEFGIGFPPRAKIFYRDKKGTAYSINWIPMGGFVRLHGEDSLDPKMLRDKKSFIGKSLWQRTAVIVAGVAMNFVLAWALITVGFTVGMRPFLVTREDVEQAIESGIAQTKPILYIHEVMEGSPAAQAGLEAQDIILEINQKMVPTAEEFLQTVEKNKANHLLVFREGQEMMYQLTPNPEGLFGISISGERMITEIRDIKYPFYRAPLEAGKEIGRLSVLTVKMIGDVVVSLVSKLAIPEGIAGPVGIAKMTHTFVQQGFMAVLQFTALISVSLGVINIMPFPALDGGRLLFIIFEIILRRRPSPKWEGVIHTVGFGLLMLLILAVTWNDISNFMK